MQDSALTKNIHDGRLNAAKYHKSYNKRRSEKKYTKY